MEQEEQHLLQLLAIYEETSMKETILEKILKYVLGIVMAICGFLISKSYDRLNENVMMMNRDIVSLRVQITEIQNKLVDDDHIKEIVQLEILKYHKQKD